MLNHTCASELSIGAEVAAGAQFKAGIVRKTHYHVECYRRGELLWEDDFDNLVVTAGLNDSLDKHLKGLNYTAAWYVGLASGSSGFAAGDTMASHGGWTENANYDEATREVLTLGTVSGGSVSNTASKASFTINTTTTVGGAFVTSVATKSDNTGVLYGAGAFTGGNRQLQSGDTLNVTLTLTATAA